ncbi:MAG: RHS repeat-associated core domain-containing protein [Bacteroidota bacterium]
METENGTDVQEEALFMNLDNTRVTFSAADANGDGGNEVSRVNGTQPMGIGIALPVEAGDTLDMQVNAYYEGGTGYSSSVGLPALVAAIAGGFGGLNGGTLEQQATYDLFNNSVGTYGLLGTGSNNLPAAYLNYILFDENLNDYQNGHIQVSTTASFNHELLQLNDIVASQDGFVYVFLTNESASSNWVYFDDMVVKHTQGDLIIQTDDYYPFGMAHDGGYQRVTAKENRFKYNGKEEITDLGINWYDYGARMYMADIGRWGVIDPLVDNFYSVSGYNYTVNNPTNFIDPDGRDFRAIIEQDEDGNYTITIQTTVHTYGNNSNADNAADYTKAFAELGIDKTFGSEGQHKVKFDVTFQHHDSKDEAIEAVEENAGDNLMQIDETLSDTELGTFNFYGSSDSDVVGYEADLTVRGGRESNVRDTRAVIHSAGHLLGLGDRYTDVGFSNDIMSTNTSATEINRQHYLDLAQFSIQNRRSAERDQNDTRVFIYRDKGRIPKRKR